MRWARMRPLTSWTIGSSSQASTSVGCRSRGSHGRLVQPWGLAPRALRDIRAGEAAGRFTVAHPEIALSTVAGGLLGLLRVHQHQPDQIDESAVDQLAEAILRMLGVPTRAAKRIAARTLPEIAGW